jgi:hypothetical protein
VRNARGGCADGGDGNQLVCHNLIIFYQQAYSELTRAGRNEEIGVGWKDDR